jgi:hypothetical protein
MTVTEDEFLSSLFHQAADSFEVPEAGPDEILRQARGSEPVPGAEAEAGTANEGVSSDVALPLAALSGSRTQSIRKVVRQHRVLSIAAALVVMVAALSTTGALLSKSSTPKQSGENASSALRTTTSTTIGAQVGAGTASPGFAAAAPSHAATTPAAGGSAQGVESSGTTSASGGTATTPAKTSSPVSSPVASGAVQPARIEQTGSLTLKVGRHALTATMTKLSFLATASGGFVANSQTQSGQGGTATGNVTLQVPVNSFATLLKDAQALGTTVQVSTKAADVTSQYVNLQEQITALQASQQQYLLIMTKATNIGDILSVESQLNSLATQIDQLQGQENLLNSETTYSTLAVTVTVATPSHHHVASPRHRTGLSEAWHKSLHGFADGVDGLVRIAGPVLFGLLCAAALLVLGRLSWRRYQRHRL